MALDPYIEDYLHRFPDLPDLTLAKKMYQDYPLLGGTIEHLRSRIRYARGHSGNFKRNLVKDEFIKPLTFNTNPWALPQSFKTDKIEYKWPKDSNKILVLSDLHVPYHDTEALTAALNYGIEWGANGILINGDLIDYHKLSRFEKDPTKRSPVEENAAARKILEIINHGFPNAHKVFLEGNHDLRWDSFLRMNAVHLYDDPRIRFRGIVGFDELGWGYVEDTGVIQISGLRIMHGHTVTRSMIPAVNSARGLFLKIKQSGIIGHTHKQSEHNETTLDGKLITTWSTGCLCELHPKYNPHGNNYSHGFATVEVFNEKEYSVKNYRILNGKIL